MTPRLIAFALVFVLLAPLAEATAGPPRSKGFYSNGTLQNGKAVPARGPDHHLLFDARCYRTRKMAARYPDPARANNYYGHPVAVSAVLEVARALRKRFPDAPRVPVGELSNRMGGQIYGHLSHQNGLDVDVFFVAAEELPGCKDGPRYELRTRTGGKSTWVVSPDFQRAWNWALVSGFATRRDVRTIFIGGLLRKDLGAWARKNGISARERRRTMRKLHPVFCRPPRGYRPDTYRGNFCPHDDHIHVRFRCPSTSPGCRRSR